MSLSQDSGTRQNDYYIDYGVDFAESYWPRIRGQKDRHSHGLRVGIRLCKARQLLTKLIHIRHLKWNYQSIDDVIQSIFSRHSKN
jgi:hypothetical protein